ncbi:hypothetical protein MNV49_002525 [Pseudohyphozyma bogoriensis]|nr:hypothetical protein MNV49_002525 [Pseudohyphozyma bogoriensis]
MPDIRVMDGAYVSSPAPRRSPAPPVARPAPPPQRRTDASGSGMTAAERKELEMLRAQKAALEKSLAESQAAYETANKGLLTRNGEISIIRKKLATAEETHAKALQDKERAKLHLEETLALKEKEFRKELNHLQTEQAFRVPTGTGDLCKADYVVAMELVEETGWVDGAPSSTGVRQSVFGSFARGHARIGRFNNAFDSPGGGGSVKRAREGSMGPPASISRMGAGRKGMTPSKGLEKGKARMMVDAEEEDEEESLVVDSRGVKRWKGEGKASKVDDMSMEEPDEEEEEDEEEYDGAMDERERDLRSEILSALFNHTTFTQFDTESAIITPASQRQSAFTRSSSAGTFRPSAATANPTAATTAAADPLPTPTASASPTPTFHSLTNLRLPPGTPPAVIAEYEEVCKELFMTLGRKRGEDMGEDEGVVLARGVGLGLENLARILESIGVIGPLIALLSLIAHLVLLFPPFTSLYLMDYEGPRQVHSKLIPLLGSIATRFGRPAPTSRSSEKSATKGIARERSRKVRGVTFRADPVKEAEKDARVEVGEEKRVALLFGVVAVLEGLAWRMPDRCESRFANFLISGDNEAPSHAMATLLDLHHPATLTTSVVRLLTLISARPGLFRSIMGIKFYDSNDVRATKVPILDRIGSLLVKQATKGSFKTMYTLDMNLLSFVTSIVTKDRDAIVLIASSPSLIPELLDKIFKDTRTVWEYDGANVSGSILALLKSVVVRLTSSVQLFYYLTCAPTSTLSIAEFIAHSAYVGLYDRFNVAFGTLSFAALPDWAVDTPQGTRLAELGNLASQIMEDASPEEAEDIESCFASPGQEDEFADEDELAELPSQE